MVKSNKSQVWSTDLIAGVLIFLIVIGIFYAFLNKQASSDTEKLELESKLASNKLVNEGNISITQENIVNEVKLRNLASNITAGPDSYEKIKQELGIKGEFCILLLDEKGNIITIQDNDNNTYAGIGYNVDPSKNLNISNGIQCGQKIN